MNAANTVIVIAGPTASGKTALSLQLAKHFNTAIISADSRQCYKELNIGVAKPSVEELASVKHYFISSHSVYDEVNAGTFEQYALNAANEIFKHGNVAIMVGGTGLYIKAFCEGIDEMPVIPEQIRKQIIEAYNNHGLEWLQQEVKETDPVFWNLAEQQNPQRLMRALEVKRATGESITTWRKGNKEVRSFNIIKTGISPAKETLHRNISQRVDNMMREGLVDEVKTLTGYRHLNALQTVGYKEIFDYLDGKKSLVQAVEQIKTNTRQYAKRQMTWFKRDHEIKWFEQGNAEAIIRCIN